MTKLLYSYALLVIILLLVMIYELILFVRRRKQFSGIRKEEQQALSYYQNVSKTNELLSELSNDISSKKEAIFLEANTTASSRTDITRYTNIDFLDIALSNKRLLAEASGIDYQITSEPLLPFTMSDIQLVSLMDNLLDNAIEACLNAQKTDGRTSFHSLTPYIRIHCKNTYSADSEQDSVYSHRIQITNSMVPAVNSLDDPMIRDIPLSTTKDDSIYHGHGHAIIENIVHLAGGQIEYQTTSDTYTVILYI